MDIVYNKKRSASRIVRQKNKVKKQKIKPSKLQMNSSLDGIGRKIPMSSVRRNEQLNFLHKTKNSFSTLQDTSNGKIVTRGYLKTIQQNKKSICSDCLDGFASNSKKRLPIAQIQSSNDRYQVEEIGFNPVNRSSFFGEELPNKDEEKLEKKVKLISSNGLLKFSLVGAMIFGMVVMGFIHQNLGDSVLAKIENSDEEANEEVKDDLYFSQEENFYNRGQITDDQKKDLEKRIREMVVGQPIENMIPYILEQDYQVAAYLVAIAKKESQWGSRVPVLNGKDCYNYWGYRENRDLMGSEGHTCFNSRKDAVETVGKRLDDLIYKQNKKTASDLIVWKCGSSCESHSQEGVDSWIDVVDMYYRKLVN